MEGTTILPSVEEYLQLRQVAGLSARDEAYVEQALENSIYGVYLREGDQLVGMGRIIGDGGTAFQIVDIAVHPAHQGQGFGKVIMEELQTYIEQSIPKKAYISLIADGKAKYLYKQFGFVETAPDSIGMYYRKS
ncbi:GNAT family N-acetyltransferase [Enterococcus olivae]